MKLQGIGKWGGPGKIQGRSKKWIRSKYNV